MTTYPRAAWGARPSRGGPGPLTPSRVEGIALHWPAMSSPLRTVDAVKAALRNWQSYHMDDQGWSDIGYQVAVDQAGNRYELRGLAIQSGANGGTDVNERFGACLLVLAPGEEPTAEMVTEVRRVVADHRRLFPKSHRIVGHGDIRPEPTTCPGPAVSRGIRAGVFEPANQEDDMAAEDVWSYKLGVIGEDGEIPAALMVRQTHNRAGGAREAARACLESMGEIAKVLGDTGMTDAEKAALVDVIAARTAAEVERLDAETVADRLEITTKEQ